MSVPVYKIEEQDGLADKIQNNLSIAYTTQVDLVRRSETPVLCQNILKAAANYSVTASISDPDLYLTKAVLVTTNWNKNDDVFGPAEVWKARRTPIHKPANIEHNENVIVGHIVDCWGLDTDGQHLSDDLELNDLPDVFHLVIGSVIYKLWENEKLVERTKKLIDAIRSNEIFVSMECAFTKFDYAIKANDDCCNIVERNKDTAWITKHLRAYGGSGMYNGYKIGRFIRNLVFSAYAFTKKPANPDSIVLNDKNLFNFSTAKILTDAKQFKKISLNLKSGVCIHIQGNQSSSINKENYCMNDIDVYKEQNTDLKKEISTLRASLDEANNKLAKADISKYEDKISSLEDKLKIAKNSVVEKDETLKEHEDKIVDLEEKYTQSQAKVEELTKQLDEIKKLEAKANRIATLVDGGINKEDATAKVTIFEQLSDEQFKVIAQELIDAAKIKTQASNENNTDISNESEEEEKEEEEKDAADANADDQALDSAKANTDVDLSTDSDNEDSQINEISELQSAIATLLDHEISDENFDKGDN